MAKRKHPTPKWLAPYLRYIAWTQWEFLNILCGLLPVPPDDVPPKPRTQLLDEAKRRDAADRHVTDAIRVGDLTVEPSIANQRLLDKITPHVDEPMRGDIHRAAALARLYSVAYHVKVDRAIRWAVSHKKLFPRCPLRVEHLTVPETAIGPPLFTIENLTTKTPAFAKQLESLMDGTTDQGARPGAPKTKLRKQRYARIDAFQDQHALPTRLAFCESLGISRAVLEGIVRDERKKYNSAAKTKLLTALGVSDKEWNSPQ